MDEQRNMPLKPIAPPPYSMGLQWWQICTTAMKRNYSAKQLRDRRQLFDSPNILFTGIHIQTHQPPPFSFSPLNHFIEFNFSTIVVACEFSTQRLFSGSFKLFHASIYTLQYYINVHVELSQYLLQSVKALRHWVFCEKNGQNVIGSWAT